MDKSPPDNSPLGHLPTLDKSPIPKMFLMVWGVGGLAPTWGVMSGWGQGEVSGGDVWREMSRVKMSNNWLIQVN